MKIEAKSDKPKLFEFKEWPCCPRCEQSMTGSYNGKAQCNRCPAQKISP